MKLCKLTEIGIEHRIIECRGGKEIKEEVYFFMWSVPVCLRDNVQTEKLNRKKELKHHTVDFWKYTLHSTFLIKCVYRVS